MTRSDAESAIAAERRRQIEQEGWSAGHDDDHTDGSLLRAAVIYYLHAKDPNAITLRPDGAPMGWPWDRKWWKPKNKPRALVVAGALCLAERDRLRRWHERVVAEDSPQRHPKDWWPPHVRQKYDQVVTALEAA